MAVRPSPRRAWLSLLWGVLFLVGINLAANEWLPARMMYWRDLGFYERHARFVQRFNATRVTDSESDKKPLVVVMFGTSKVVNGFAGEQLEATLQTQFDRPVVAANYGILAGSPVHALLYLGRMLRQGPRPDLVLIEAYPGYLDEAMSSEGMTQTIKQPEATDLAWLSQWDIQLPPQLTNESPTQLAIYDYRVELLRASCIPLARCGTNYRADAFGALKVADVPLDSPERLTRTKIAHDQLRNCYLNYRVGGPGWKAVAAMLDVCRENNIATAVVIMPEGPALRSVYRPGTLAELKQRIDQLVRQHHSIAIDASEWMNEDSFIDSHHLMARGALKFTEQLAQELLSHPAFEGGATHKQELARRND